MPESLYLVIAVLVSRPVMIQKTARLLQGKNFCEARYTVEHELPTVGGNRGGADAPHQRTPPQLRQRPERGKCLPPTLARLSRQNKPASNLLGTTQPLNTHREIQPYIFA